MNDIFFYHESVCLYGWLYGVKGRGGGLATQVSGQLWGG